MKLPCIKNEKGLTLVEIVAAVTIMAITFVVFMSLFSQSSKISAGNRNKTDMVIVAQDLMERASKADGFSVLTQSGNIGQIDITSQIKDIYQPKYYASRTVEVITPGGLIKIIIKVWSKSNTSSSVTLVTMLSNT